jgi:hypothetical protein
MLPRGNTLPFLAQRIRTDFNPKKAKLVKNERILIGHAYRPEFVPRFWKRGTNCTPFPYVRDLAHPTKYQRGRFMLK